MFAELGFETSFAIFFIVYSSLSIGVFLLWDKIGIDATKRSARSYSNLLFLLRMSPFITASITTLFFAVPSFILLEPHKTSEESMSWMVITLGYCGIAVLLAGIWNSLRAMHRARRCTKKWALDAQAIQTRAASPIPVRVSSTAPPMTASGILRPHIWLSRAAEFVLSEKELNRALQHEVFHLQRRDNLRKLALRFVAFPGMVELESNWHEAAEMAADDAAVESASEALDLAAALIKLSRLLPVQNPELSATLVHSPMQSVSARVARLLAWSRQEETTTLIETYSPKYWFAVVATTLTVLAAIYSQLLVRIHAATEWLVR
jgi:beta-lactamase regulating signal transducer with metallopeptidase domain